jgi:hypothetical protein
MPNLLLIHGPAVKLTVDGVNLGAVRTHFPKISQLTVAAIVEHSCPDYEVRVVDMKAAGSAHETHFKDVAYGGRTIAAHRVGLPFADVADDVAWADDILFTSNFTQEAGVIGDLIEFAKRVNPRVRCLVGGSDAMVRRRECDRHAYFYGRGADYVGGGDGETLIPRVLRGETPAERSSVLRDFNAVPDPALGRADLTTYVESHEGGLPEGVHPPLMYLETSRGCRQSCDFCSTPFTKGVYRYMSQPRIEALLEHCRAFGIRTLLLIEDNILSRLDLPGGRAAVLEWFHYMHRRRFVWEFANGVEIGKLEQNGALDAELIEALFAYDGSSGCFRSYIPLERIDTNGLPYRKLKMFDVQKQILCAIAQQGVPVMNLGVIVGNPQETRASLAITERRMFELKDAIGNASRGRTFPFANIFLHIPICGTNDYRRFYDERRLEFDIDSDPELFNFYTSVLRGDHFRFDEITELRSEMAHRINGEELMQLWMKGGKYYPDGLAGSRAPAMLHPTVEAVR